MTDSKAVKILRTLTKEEFKNFGKFIASPYFNSSKDVINFFNQIKKFYPEFKNKSLTLENVFKKVFSSQKYNEGKMRNLISDTAKLAEKFLAVEHYGTDKFKMEFGTVMSLVSRNEQSFSEKLIEKLIRKNCKGDSVKKENFSEIMELLRLKLRGTLASDSEKYLDTLKKQSGLAAANFLRYIFWGKQQQLVDYHNYNLEYSTLCTSFFDSLDTDKFVRLLQGEGGEYAPVLSMEIYLQKAFVGEDIDVNIKKFEDAFEKLYRTLSKTFSAHLLRAAQNVYAKKMNHNSGYQEEIYYMRKLFDNYSFMEKEGLFEIPDILLGSSFRMVSYVGSNLHEFDWTLMFLDKYASTLPDEYRDDMINMCKGELCFNKGENQTALEYYGRVVKPNYYSLWHMKMALCMIHFNLENYETVLSISDAALVEIRRKYKGNSTRNLNLEFFKFMKRLVSVKLNPEKTALEKLRCDAVHAEYYKFKPGKFLDKSLMELEKEIK